MEWVVMSNHFRRFYTRVGMICDLEDVLLVEANVGRMDVVQLIRGWEKSCATQRMVETPYMVGC